MGIEQSDNEKYYKKKQEEKEKQETHDFFESKKLSRETHDLLNKLAQEIARDFGIDVSKVQEMISGDTLSNLEDLRSGVESGNINIGKLKDAIKQAKNQVEDLSKKKIEHLKQSVDTTKYLPDIHKYHGAKKIFSQNILQKAYDPQSFSDQLIGIGIGFFDSSEAIILFTYSLSKGIILTPYHIYLLLTGKKSYDFKSKI